MKFKDIPQMKRSYYTVNIPISSLKETLARHKESQEKFGYKFELNPEFQRGHVWTQQQQIDYVEWILRDGSSGRDIYFNHPKWMSDYKADMVCVDGLQRLTALLAFLDGEIPAFGHYVHEYEDRMPWYDLIFHIGAFSEKEAVEWYLEMNFKGTPHTDAELNRVRKLLEEKYK